jgi:hypothetical protein
MRAKGQEMADSPRFGNVEELERMGQTITISEDLHARLDESARQRGLESIEKLLEVWQVAEDALRQRERNDAAAPIDAVSERIFETWGEVAERAYWIRQDQTL